MHQNTNPAISTPTTRNPLGVAFTGTTCHAGPTGHDHDVPADASQITSALSYWVSPVPVQTSRARNGVMVRRFGFINYWPATGHMHILQRDGTLPSEIGALFATAEHPKQDPDQWPVHPCHPERRRIALYRPIDGQYLAEAAAIMFDDLEHAEQTEAMTSWAEDLTNA